MATLVSALLVTSIAAAENPRTAGTKGTVTIWDESGSVVLDHRSCVKTRFSWNYSTCGDILRSRFKAQTCSTAGKGTHKYLYQVGDSKPLRSQVYCK